MRKKLIWTLLFVVIMIATFFLYRQYNRKPADLLDATPAFTVTAANLVTEFETDEAAANKKFLGKVIQVNGTIISTDFGQDTLMNIIVGDSLRRVSCQFDKRHHSDIERLQAMKSISVKGICIGYLMDVELNRCVLVK